MKHINRKKKCFILVAFLLLIILIIVGFQFLNRNQDKLEYGKYQITDCIFTSAISSDSGEAARLKTCVVDVSEDSFAITYPQGMLESLTDVTYKKEKMTSEIIEKLETYQAPVSKYHSKTVYSVCGNGSNESYALYLLDDVIWLVKYSTGNSIYSISVLERID